MEPWAEPDGVRPPAQANDGVTWFGHSTVRVDLDGVSVLTEPVLRRWIKWPNLIEKVVLVTMITVVFAHVLNPRRRRRRSPSA